MGINADSDAAVKQLQEDLRKVGEWSKKWQMPFNLDKCKIMDIGEMFLPLHQLLETDHFT